MEKKYMNMLTSKCLNTGINPAAFNKGAWFVGSHFDDICFHLGVEETEQGNMSSCVLRYFETPKVKEGIRSYAKILMTRKIFPV